MPIAILRSNPVCKAKGSLPIAANIGKIRSSTALQSIAHAPKQEKRRRLAIVVIIVAALCVLVPIVYWLGRGIDPSAKEIPEDPIQPSAVEIAPEMPPPLHVFPFGEKLPAQEEYREGICHFEYAQLRSYIFRQDFEEIAVIKDAKKVDPGKPPMEMPPGPDELIFKKIDELPALTGYKLAETVRPVRMGVIVASFPYRLQLKEFCKALNVTPEALLEQIIEEQVPGPDGKSVMRKLPAFRFKGVDVQRRQVDSAGKPIPHKGTDGKMVADGWYDISLGDKYRDYLMTSGKRTLPDRPELGPVLVNGLAMPRLCEMRSEKYKPIELDLKNIKTALKPFEDNKDKVPVRPKQFQDDDDFNPFTRPGPANPPRPGPPASPRQPAPAKNIDPVQFSLIRLIDVTGLEPGKSYEYRIKVRMANPAYGKPRAEGADPKIADRLELVSEEWYPIPGRLVVPTELVVYAVDQAAVDQAAVDQAAVDQAAVDQPKRFANPPVDPRVSTVLQLHCWVENISMKDRIVIPVGEWAVAERVIVNRGERIDRPVKVLVPCYKPTLGGFGFVEPTGVAVFFGREKEEYSTLLDFASGDYSYVRNKDKKIPERARGEVLILTPDGRIQAHDTVTDAKTKERTDRLKVWRDRIEEVRTPGPMQPNPLGPPPPRRD